MRTNAVKAWHTKTHAKLEDHFGIFGKVFPVRHVVVDKQVFVIPTEGYGK